MRDLQTTAREGISSSRTDILSIMKKQYIFTKHVLIWWIVTYFETITLRKISGPPTAVQ